MQKYDFKQKTYDLKYELLENDMNKFYNTRIHKLYRIKALRDFGDVKKGDLGGYIESNFNLSHDGLCWVYDNAIVLGDAEVYHNAKIYGNAKICGNTKVFGNAQVGENAIIQDNVHIYDDAKVTGIAHIGGGATICGCSYIYHENDYAVIKGVGPENRTLTFTRDKDYNIFVKCGYFYGTLDEFRYELKHSLYNDIPYEKERIEKMFFIKIFQRIC